MSVNIYDAQAKKPSSLRGSKSEGSASQQDEGHNGVGGGGGGGGEGGGRPPETNVTHHRVRHAIHHSHGLLASEPTNMARAIWHPKALPPWKPRPPHDRLLCGQRYEPVRDSLPDGAMRQYHWLS